FANVVAAELFERALTAARHLPDAPPDQVASIWEDLGDVCEIFAHYERASEAFAEARRLRRDDELAQTRLLLKEGHIRENSGKYSDALRWYGRALKRAVGLEGAAGVETRSEIELAYASVRHRQGRFEDAIEWSRRAAEHAEAVDHRAGLARAYFLLDLAHT